VWLHLRDGDLVAQPEHTHDEITITDNHYHILQVGLPRLMAACPGVSLRLHITGDTPCQQYVFQVLEPSPSFQRLIKCHNSWVSCQVKDARCMLLYRMPACKCQPLPDTTI
jgi:hypothetical protein